MHVDPEGNISLLFTILIGALISAASVYVGDVIKEISEDGFQWSDFKPTSSIKSYVISALTGALISFIGSLEISVLYMAPLCGLINSTSDWLTGDVTNFKQFCQAFAVYTAVSFLTLRSGRMAKKIKITKGNGNPSTFSNIIDKTIDIIEWFLKKYGKIINNAVSAVIGTLKGVK